MKPGTLLPGGYRLERQLGHGGHLGGGYCVATWLARDDLGQPVVLRFHPTFVSDEYGGGDDLWDSIAPMCEGLKRLPMLPLFRGIATWSFYGHDPSERRITLIRRYYDTKLVQCFPPAITANADGRPNPDFLAAFQDIAAGIDTLYQNWGEEIEVGVHLDNLFMDDTHAVLADFGVQALGRVIEEGYSGPRSASPRLCDYPTTYLEKGFLPRTKPQADAQFLLAATYYQARTGRPFFDTKNDATENRPMDRLMRLRDQCVAYLHGQRLSLDLLPDRREREAVAKALAVNRKHRFPSCTAFVQALQ